MQVDFERSGIERTQQFCCRQKQFIDKIKKKWRALKPIHGNKISLKSFLQIEGLRKLLKSLLLILQIADFGGLSVDSMDIRAVKAPMKKIFKDERKVKGLSNTFGTLHFKALLKVF